MAISSSFSSDLQIEDNRKTVPVEGSCRRHGILITPYKRNGVERSVGWRMRSSGTLGGAVRRRLIRSMNVGSEIGIQHTGQKLQTVLQKIRAAQGLETVESLQNRYMPCTFTSVLCGLSICVRPLLMFSLFR